MISAVKKKAAKGKQKFSAGKRMAKGKKAGKHTSSLSIMKKKSRC